MDVVIKLKSGEKYKYIMRYYVNMKGDIITIVSYDNCSMSFNRNDIEYIKCIDPTVLPY